MERAIFDENQPQGTKSLANLRNTLRGLHQGDLMPLRPRASMSVDDMEYSTDALAQSAWSGTGVTVATEGTTKNAGNFGLKLTIDGTGNRTASKTQVLDLSAFVSLTFWEQVNVTSSAFQLYLKDSSNNESYWDLTSDGTISTWKQHTLTLASPDSDSGTAADLSDIASWGFLGLDASKVYYIDTVKAICGLNVVVSGASIGDGFYQPIYINNTHLTYAGGSSPALVAPSVNPRIDLLTIDTSGVLAWTAGAENSSPVAPTYPADKIPICLVYCKTTMVKVVDYENAAANPNEGYIYKDVRPLFSETFADATKIESPDTTKYFEALDAGLKIVAGSDAAGDMYYRGATYLTRLALGAANLKQFVNAGATAPEWSSGLKIGSFIRDMAAASGDVAYTGVGFKPSIIIFISSSATSLFIGLDDGTNHYYAGNFNSASFDVSTSQSINFRDTTNQQLGYLKTLDSDGFTITYTKSSSPSGTGTVIYLALR